MLQPHKIAIPTKNRYDNYLNTLRLLANRSLFDVYLFVDDESQLDKYRETHPHEKIIVANTSGIQNVRNYIYDFFGKGARIITMCDDVEGVYRLVGKGGQAFTEVLEQDLYDLIANGFELCEKNKTKLWGVYPMKNDFYMSHSISNNGFIIGTFSGIIISDIRNSLELACKEDYEFTLEHILKYKKVVRFNNYCVKAKHYTNKGGVVGEGREEKDRHACQFLMAKYPHYVRLNPTRENEILLKF